MFRQITGESPSKYIWH
ncbi:hypothetical protein [Phocaeicola coprophilus]